MFEIDGAAPLQGKGLGEKTRVNPAQDEEARQLAAAAVKFEAFFVAQMLQQMRQATAALADEDGALRRQPNQAPLALADQAVADALAQGRAFGIADMLVRQMGAQGTAATGE